MGRILISVGVLLTGACGSDAEPSPATGYPQPPGEATPASTSSVGMGGQASTDGATASAETSTTSEVTNEQASTANGNTGVQSSTGAVTTGGQTSTGFGAAGGQPSTDSAAMDGQTNTASGTTGEATTDSLSFAADIWPLWSMVRDPVFVYRGMGSYSGCTDVGVCHGGENPGAGLRMPDTQTAYAQMIDTPSVSSLCAGTERVVVGDPESSCLILFYQGRLGNDDLGWVDDAEIELMREWIRQGALP